MRQAGIEYGRLIGLLCVILIHANNLGLFGEYRSAGFVVDEASRFAVPMFFIVSGFFWKEKLFADPVPNLLSLAVRLVPAMVFWTILYVVLDVSGLLYPGSFEGGILAKLAIPMNGGPGLHLWFVPALLIGTIFCVFGIRIFGERPFFGIALLLMILGVMFGAYQRQLGFQLQNIFYRNGILFAPFYLAAGYLIGKYQVKISMFLAIGISAFGFGVHLAEGYFFTLRYPWGHDFSFGTVPFAIGAFLAFRKIERTTLPFSDWGQHVFGAYLIHLLVLKIAVNVSDFRGITATIAIALLTFFASLLLSKILKAIPVLRRVV